MLQAKSLPKRTWSAGYCVCPDSQGAMRLQQGCAAAMLNVPWHVGALLLMRHCQPCCSKAPANKAASCCSRPDYAAGTLHHESRQHRAVQSKQGCAVQHMGAAGSIMHSGSPFSHNLSLVPSWLQNVGLSPSSHHTQTAGQAAQWSRLQLPVWRWPEQTPSHCCRLCCASGFVGPLAGPLVLPADQPHQCCCGQGRHSAQQAPGEGFDLLVKSFGGNACGGRVKGVEHHLRHTGTHQHSDIAN